MLVQNIEDQQLSKGPQIPTSLRYGETKRYTKRLMAQSQDVATSLAFTDPIIQGNIQCRICLDNEFNNQNELVSPCRCIGSVKFVHDKCYRKWIEKQFQSKHRKQRLQMMSSGIQCELCKWRIYLNFKHQCRCMKLAHFIAKFNQSRLMFFLLVFFLATNLACLSYISYYTATNTMNVKSYLASFIVIMCVYLFLAITAALSMFHFVTDYMIEKVWVLESFSGSQPVKTGFNFRKKQVIPQASMQQIS